MFSSGPNTPKTLTRLHGASGMNLLLVVLIVLSLSLCQPIHTRHPLRGLPRPPQRQGLGAHRRPIVFPK